MSAGLLRGAGRERVGAELCACRGQRSAQTHTVLFVFRAASSGLWCAGIGQFVCGKVVKVAASSVYMCLCVCDTSTWMVVNHR